MTDAHGSGRLEAAIIRRFWDGRSAQAEDPRSTTLVGGSIERAAREVSYYQQWMFRSLGAVGCSWRRAADLACGNGDWAVVLAARAERLFALDLTAGFVAHCERRLEAAGLAGRASVSVGDLTRCELPGELDVAVLGAVLQYIDDEQVPAILQRVHAALAPGGVLYMRTTIARGPERVDNCTSEYQATYRPLAFYADALARSGFTVACAAITELVVPVEHTRRMLGPLFPWVGPLLTVPYRLGWRMARARKATEVWACVARRSGDVG